MEAVVANEDKPSESCWQKDNTRRHSQKTVIRWAVYGQGYTLHAALV